MSKFPRETIVIASAIVGANLLAFAYHANSVQSLECFQSWLPQPQDQRPRLDSSATPLDQRGRKEGYYDVRLKKDVSFPVQPAPATHSYLPLQQPADAASVGTETAAPSTPVRSVKPKTIRSEISNAEWAAMDGDQRFAVQSADATIAAIDAGEGR